MRVIKIDVEKQEVGFIEIEPKAKEIAKVIGNGCNFIAGGIELDNDVIMVDDEALLRPDDIKGGFRYSGLDYPVINNAVILGVDNDGEWINCKSTLEEIKSKIKFVRIQPKLM